MNGYNVHEALYITCETWASGWGQYMSHGENVLQQKNVLYLIIVMKVCMHNDYVID